MCTPFRQNTDLRQDPFFIGRSQELKEIITNLLQNRHTLITGDRGIGKTRLMQEALSILNRTVHHIDLAKLPRSSERRFCIYIDSPAPLSKFMKCLASELMRLEQLKAVNAIKENELPQAIIKAISTSGRKHILFVDSLDTVTPSHHIFLERLLDAAVICGSSLSVKQQPVLKRIFDTFAVVPVRTELRNGKSPSPDAAFSYKIIERHKIGIHPVHHVKAKRYTITFLLAPCSLLHAHKGVFLCSPVSICVRKNNPPGEMPATGSGLRPVVDRHADSDRRSALWRINT